MLSAPSPFSLILFGASGHLAQLKLYPALYTLALKKRMPEQYAIVGYARSTMDDAGFRKIIEESVRAAMPAVTEKALAEFLTHCHYHAGAYDKKKDFVALAEKLTTYEKNWKDPVRLAYLSVPPEVFTAISENLCSGGIHAKGKRFGCIVEKPVGHDLKSFEEIRAQLTSCFADDEIFLLDHYLGKDAVRNIYYLRSANPILERVFKNTIIDHVEITAAEEAGIQGRAGYFEAAGTFRDFFQSHLLMMASLLTMRLSDDPGTLLPNRLDALRQFYLPPAADMGDIVLQGQYVGYLDEKNVAKNSRANTYACLQLHSRIARWQGIPFYLRSGKRLPRKETRISIQFQEPRAVGKGAGPNRIDIILQGEAGMRIHMQTRISGTEPSFRPLVMTDPLVCVGDCLPEHSLLLLEAIHGRQTWFMSFEEVRTAWRLIDPVIAYLEKSDTPLHIYPAGTMGPEAADAWIARDGRKWVS